MVTVALGTLSDEQRTAHLALVEPDAGHAPAAWALARRSLPHAPVLAPAPAALHPDVAWPEPPADWFVDQPGWVGLAEQLTASASSALAAAQEIHSIVITEERTAGRYASADGAGRQWVNRRFELEAVVQASGARLRGLPLSVADGDPAAVTECVAGTAVLASVVPAGPTPTGHLLVLPTAMTDLLRLLAAAAPQETEGPATRSARCHLVDDGRAAGSPLAAPVDHEGTPTGRTTLMRSDGAPVGLRTRSGYVGRRDPGVLTGHGRRVDWHTAPRPTPSSVRLEPDGPDSTLTYDGSYTGAAVTRVHGAGTQFLRAGPTLTIALLGVHLQRGRAVTGWGPMTVAVTPRQILESVQAVSPVTAHLPGEVATAAQSALVDLDLLNRSR
jgi:predicted Zn-dependent protease